MRRPILLVLLMTGCFPSVAFVRSDVRSVDCESGAFDAELIVERQSARKVKVVYEVLPGSVNVEAVEHAPKRAVLQGKEAKRTSIQVRGSVVDHCASAGVNLLASYAPSGTTGYVEVERVLPVSSPAGVASGPDGAFEYPLTLTCCGAQGAGTFAVAVAGAEGASDVRVEPPKVQCGAQEQHVVSVRGKLTDGDSGRIRLVVTDESTGATCEQADAVTRGRTSSPSASAGSDPGSN